VEKFKVGEALFSQAFGWDCTKKSVKLQKMQNMDMYSSVM
jgi:hypothetical protein